MRLLRIGLLTAVVLALLALPATRHRMFTVNGLGGFAAFYCGGSVIAHGRDPYRAEPLRACERALPSYRYDAAGVVEPAPFPPVVLAAFAVPALLPFAWAVGLYAALALAAFAVAAGALQRLTRFSPWFAGASLALAALYQNLRFGELPPLVIGVVCAAALLLERGRPRASAFVALAALIEPHVAGPVLLALFVAAKPTRLPLALAGVLLAAISVVALDPGLTVEYFTRVLPAHAASEVTANDQFSVTWIAHALGAGDGWAVRAGGVSYVVMAWLGIVAGVRLAQRYARPSFVVLVPAAFAVIGGTFIHDVQLPIAIPAALLLASVTRGPVRALALIAGFGLGLMWFDDFSAALALGVAGVMAWSAPFPPIGVPRRVLRTVLICAAYACIVVAFHLLSPVHTAVAAHPDVAGPPQELASAAWGRFVRLTAYGGGSLRTYAQKIPLWIAIALLACAVLRAAFAPLPLRPGPSAQPVR